MKLERIIKELNKHIKEKQPIQKASYGEWYCDFTTDLFPENVNVKEVQFSTIDEHRWCGFQDVVFELTLDDEVLFVELNLITQSYSEMQSLKDIYHAYKRIDRVYPSEKTITVYKKI